MTRFARASGSKSSNERVPERATPWSVMKDEMQRVQQENQDSKERAKHDKVRQQNYDNFLKQQASEVTTEWADFSDIEAPQKKEKKIGKGIEKKKKNKEKKDMNKTISKKDMLEMLKPDPKIDSQVEKLTSQIDKILNKQKPKIDMEREIIKEKDTFSSKTEKPAKNKKSKKKSKVSLSSEVVQDKIDEPDAFSSKTEKPAKNKKSKGSLSSEVVQYKIDEPDNENAPTEVSAKIVVPNIKIKKQKQNKKKVLKIQPVEQKTQNESDENNLNKEVIKKNKNIKTEELQNKDESIIKDGNTETQKITKSMRKRLMKKKKKEGQKRELNNESEEVPPKTPKVNQNEKDSRKRKLPDDNVETPNKFPRKQQTMKVAKVRDNKEHPRRKPDEGPFKMTFNGVEVEVIKFEGFPIKKEDAERLIELKKQMISKGIPRSEVKRSMQLERRRAEKALARERKKVCFQCRKAGHMLSECPELNSEQISFSGSGICFKCGSTEHTHFECKVTKTDDYKFASCFICREQGHIARQCPDNPKGLYPDGGACKLCGDVTHLKKDCPQAMKEKEDNSISLNTITGGNIETIDEGLNKSVSKSAPVKNKIVKF